MFLFITKIISRKFYLHFCVVDGGNHAFKPVHKAFYITCVHVLFAFHGKN